LFAFRNRSEKGSYVRYKFVFNKLLESDILSGALGGVA